MADDIGEVVGKPEIARLLGVAPGTPATWIQRRDTTQIPEPDYPDVNGLDTWRRETIEEWAVETGRAKENQ